jgi:hypothetical protein
MDDLSHIFWREADVLTRLSGKAPLLDIGTVLFVFVDFMFEFNGHVILVVATLVYACNITLKVNITEAMILRIIANYQNRGIAYKLALAMRYDRPMFELSEDGSASD